MDSLLRSQFFLALNPCLDLPLDFLDPQAHVEFDQVVQLIELLCGVVEIESRVRGLGAVVDFEIGELFLRLTLPGHTF